MIVARSGDLINPDFRGTRGFSSVVLRGPRKEPREAEVGRAPDCPLEVRGGIPGTTGRRSGQALRQGRDAVSVTRPQRWPTLPVGVVWRREC